MAENKSEITVIIPNYNGKKFLADCLDSLMKQTNTDFEILIVDNGSEDESQNLIKSTYPQVKLIENEKNRGFAAAVNQGINHSDSPYVLLLNNDTKAAPDFIEEILKCMKEKKDAFSISAKMLQMNSPHKIDSCGDHYCALGWAYGLGKGKEEKEFQGEAKKVFSACAGAALYKRKVLEETGLFDEAHFAYLEDVDLGYRARLLGYQNYVCYKAKVYHYGSGFSGSRYNDFKIRLSGRNNVYLIYKNMPILQIILNSPFLLIGFLIKAIFFTTKGFGLKYCESLIEGIKMCHSSSDRRKFRVSKEKCINYVTIQLELWKNSFLLLWK